MISTAILVLSHGGAVARTLSVQKKKGNGKIFLDSSTVYYPEWQFQLRTITQFMEKILQYQNHDFLVSVDSWAVDGWSTSVPLFLLLTSAATGEQLPKNFFSTGCMFSPDGWISHGKPEAVQAKIDALEGFSHGVVQAPVFLIPFSLDTYKSEAVHLRHIRSMFSALEIALPYTYQKCSLEIQNLIQAQAQPDLRQILDYLPGAGDAFVLVPADASSKSRKPSIDISQVGSTPFIMENPLAGYLSLYLIRDNRVLLKHRYTDVNRARADALHYQEVMHEVP
ncbi:MAG: hypothetical protein HXS41_04260 [Theionarchaea archaeon]|nr:hypothetical protein [Theionarchaea archaeon]MBU6999589.1 hypothetical protein [Theionarchaea archaeon]MBU7020251.1 hypothetical protein [Theionarchaea archaeon]MBU7035646.1 hypothetical protein [Theionarchaea archaeon]MBU7041206.1 hypothetical protein [Theionarchaea archaeon]